ncbi:hypothetical protein OG379_00930 [Streptomyces sp. NBC_01166]|uniref:tetratricopeptide repeat protein n=1 Tax=Streptomyces sp. NBC_01166 TaxID=2903755 RepID=UPI00386A12AA|nr:hypothetical protein OG379_00930 [Streptomyces sp. NBC_01166]
MSAAQTVAVGDLDPFALEVHRAISPSASMALPALPVYVDRAHDRYLKEAVTRATAGTSVLVTLVGGSSTGKTRACWEAVRRLPEGWRVWHPYDPTRAHAAAEAISAVGPRTVIWLNEAQHYFLSPEPAVAERITAGLRTLLQDRRRGPVLVMATMWPQYWASLTMRPVTGEDAFSQQRELLTNTGEHTVVPPAFTGADLEVLRARSAEDPRLADALAKAVDGEVTQYLAGVPELVTRYRTAPTGASALLHAAMDFRRLGHTPVLSHELLAEAAEGYLSASTRNELGPRWFQEALQYCAAPCKGAPGPLAALSPRSPSAGRASRLSDYLEQHGQRTRGGLCPPASFWEAAVRHPPDLISVQALAWSAQKRARYRHAAGLHLIAAEAGNVSSLGALVALRNQTGDIAGARRFAHAAAAAGDPSSLTRLALIQDGDTEAAERMAHAAAEAGDTRALAQLGKRRESVGDLKGAQQLYRAAAEKRDSYALARLTALRAQAGDLEDAELLARTAAGLGALQPLIDLALQCGNAHDFTRAERLARTAAELGVLRPLIDLALQCGDAHDFTRAEQLALTAGKKGEHGLLAVMAQRRQDAGDVEGAKHFARAAASGGDTSVAMGLAEQRSVIHDRAGAERFHQIAAEAGDLKAFVLLAHQGAERRLAEGDTDGAEQLLQAAAETGDAAAFCRLAELRDHVGDTEGADGFFIAAAKAGAASDLLNRANYLDNYASDLALASRFARFAAEAGHPGARSLLVSLLREMGRDEEAARWTAVPQEEATSNGELPIPDSEEPLSAACESGGRHAPNELARHRERADEVAVAEQIDRAVEEGHVETLTRLGYRRLNAGDIAGAERLARAAADAGEVSLALHLGDQRESARDSAGAERLYRVAADAGSTIALDRLAAIRERTGFPSQAEELARSAADAGNVAAITSLIRARAGAGDFEGAERFALEAGAAGHGDALVFLVQCRELAGDAAGAERLCQAAVDAGHIGALDDLARLRRQTMPSDPSVDEIPRFGLEPDGRVSPPW